ncbi:hypothetical protein R1sor_023119 [Riccia sorocarpa]|uniref:Uncharacterized protein n=1 Tax=Riccia sorocarpa TaxID=122646 RepID=A0ABD3GLR7_9MARC
MNLSICSTNLLLNSYRNPLSLFFYLNVSQNVNGGGIKCKRRVEVRKRGRLNVLGRKESSRLILTLYTDKNAGIEEENWDAGITWAMLAAELAVMPSLEDNVQNDGGDIHIIDLNVSKAASKLGRFCKTAAILQTMESTPSRDRMVACIEDLIVRRRGIPVRQAQALSWYEFLVVFKKEDDKE